MPSYHASWAYFPHYNTNEFYELNMEMVKKYDMWFVLTICYFNKHIYELVLHSGSNIQGDAQISKPLNSIWKSKYCQVLCLEKGVENALFR